jgi:hypothetical protein
MHINVAREAHGNELIKNNTPLRIVSNMFQSSSGAMKTTVFGLWLSIESLASAQQVYLAANGYTPRPQCSDCSTTREPQYTYTPFAYTMTSTVRYATSRPSPTTTTTHAPPPESLTSLIPSQSYTTWGKWDPVANMSATDSDNPYGNAAWTALWVHANPPNFTQEAASAIYSTTIPYRLQN